MLGVPIGDPYSDGLNDLDDIPPHYLKEIEHFFQVYKDLEGTRTVTRGFEGAAARASQAIAEAMNTYRRSSATERGSAGPAAIERHRRGWLGACPFAVAVSIAFFGSRLYPARRSSDSARAWRCSISTAACITRFAHSQRRTVTGSVSSPLTCERRVPSYPPLTLLLRLPLGRFLTRSRPESMPSSPWASCYLARIRSRPRAATRQRPRSCCSPRPCCDSARPLESGARASCRRAGARELSPLFKARQAPGWPPRGSRRC